MIRDSFLANRISTTSRFVFAVLLINNLHCPYKLIDGLLGFVGHADQFHD